MRTDAELLEAWRGGDRQAGNELLERHFDSLYRFFRNKVDEGADDLIQQTMLAAVRGADGFRQEASFRTWLFTIAHHELYAHWRGRLKGRGQDIGEISLADLKTSPSGLVAKRREHQLLLVALRAIPFDLQVALELYYWEQLDGPDLAQVLGVPEGTVRSRLRRAREALSVKIAELTESGEDFGGVSVSDLDAWATALRADLTDQEDEPE